MPYWVTGARRLQTEWWSRQTSSIQYWQALAFTENNFSWTKSCGTVTAKLSFEIYDVLVSNPKQNRWRGPIFDIYSIFYLSFLSSDRTLSPRLMHSTSLGTLIYICLHTRTAPHTFSMHTHTYIHTYIHKHYIRTHIHIWTHTYVHTHIPTHIKTYIHVNNTYINTYIRTYVRTHTHNTYVHTHMHTYTYMRIFILVIKQLDAQNFVLQ